LKNLLLDFSAQLLYNNYQLEEFMQTLIQQLRDSKKLQDGLPVPPSALSLRAANAIEKLIQIVKGLELSNNTMGRELSDAQITITKLQIALANRTKELEDAKKTYYYKSASGNDTPTFADAADNIVNNSGSEVLN
jgi:hypothetical protein